MKVDVLALGMLTALKRGFDMLADQGRGAPGAGDVPGEDAGVYAMLSRADIGGRLPSRERRRQMSMLPRMKPREFYDLVIEVGDQCRPGPIQG
jgi:error-prone DNA polymerase